DNPLALMIVASSRQVLAVNRLPRLLDLQKQRILRAVSLQQDDIVAQADASRTYDLESHVDRLEKIEQMPALGGEGLAICCERIKHTRRVHARYTPGIGATVAEAGPATAVDLRKLLQQIAWVGAPRLLQRALDRLDESLATELLARHLQNRLSCELRDPLEVGFEEYLGRAPAHR